MSKRKPKPGEKVATPADVQAVWEGWKGPKPPSVRNVAAAMKAQGYSINKNKVAGFRSDKWQEPVIEVKPVDVLVAGAKKLKSAALHNSATVKPATEGQRAEVDVIATTPGGDAEKFYRDRQAERAKRVKLLTEKTEAELIELRRKTTLALQIVTAEDMIERLELMLLTPDKAAKMYEAVAIEESAAPLAPGRPGDSAKDIDAAPVLTNSKISALDAFRARLESGR